QIGGGPRKFLLGHSPERLPAVDPHVGVVVVNAGGWGVYRVGYPAEHLAALAERLDDLDALERFNLFADSWALALAGRGGVEGLLSLATRLGSEEDPSTFSVVAGALGLCDRVVAGTDRPALQAAVRALFGPRAEALGWEQREGEGERVPTLRALLLSELGTVGADPAVQAEAARRFDASREGPAIDPDLEEAVLRTVADQRRPGDYEAMLERYRHPATPQEELRYLMALAAFPDVGLAERTFTLALKEVRSQNAPYLVASLLANRVGGPAVWERVKAEWSRMLDRFPVNSHSRMLQGCRSLCGDPALAEDVSAFLHAHPLQTAQRTVTQMLERLAINVAFGERWRDRLGGVLAGVAGRSSPS
ncbi:MAG: ERAP1-like C-terminal domain-containing protein, partial [Acidimicrobiales bacterium]